MLPELATPAVLTALPNPVDFVGDYFLLSDGSLVTIAQEDNQLLLGLPGKANASLKPTDQDAWVCPSLSVKVVGQRDASGAINGLAIQSLLMNVAARRRPDYTLLTEQLAEYQGRYYCEELDTYYQLVVEQGKLLARHQRHSDLPLIPSAHDAFVGGNSRAGLVQFERDQAGQVTGMNWAGNRVRHIWFERV